MAREVCNLVFFKGMKLQDAVDEVIHKELEVMVTGAQLTPLQAITSATRFRSPRTLALSFSPTRHIGSTGAWIAPVQGEGELVWMEP